MLPSEPKIFHGRESELSDILQLLRKKAPRIAILGTGGMGKTSLARAVLHHAEVSAQYTQHRYFVACDSANSKVELAALIGTHLGLKPSKDLTQAVVKFLVTVSPGLLILDNLETVWEPTELRGDIEEFLSLLTDLKNLALIVSGSASFLDLTHATQITMRGAERPAKVQWSHPFLLPLQPLKHHAAQQTFIDIAEDHHNPEDIDRVLSLTDNMPLAINLIAHLVDVEGCPSVLSRWEAERTSVISEGYDKKSNLDVSISLSMSSPRIRAVPQAQELLSLLSMLPDGLSDVELLQSKLPIEDIRNCKTTLIRTALAYLDDKKQLKALVPIREYMLKTHPPKNELVKPLFKHFHELLELHKDSSGTEMNSTTVGQISSNMANIQSLLWNGLQKDHPDLMDSVLSALYLNLFSRITGQGSISLLGQLHKILPHLCDHWLEVYFITELFASYKHVSISNPETLLAQVLEHFEYFDDPDLKCGLPMLVSYMNTDISVQVNYTVMLHTIIQHRVPIFLWPWIFVTRLYCWQLHLATQKDIPKHYCNLQRLTGSLVTICQPDYMHVRHRGWPGFLPIYMMKHGHFEWKQLPGPNLVTTRKASLSVREQEIFWFSVVCLVVT
jgi:Cdc6-like AAA superfamily ATPase